MEPCHQGYGLVLSKGIFFGSFFEISHKFPNSQRSNNIRRNYSNQTQETLKTLDLLLSPNICSFLASAAASILGPRLNFDMNLNPSTPMGAVVAHIVAKNRATSAIRLDGKDLMIMLFVFRRSISGVLGSTFSWSSFAWYHPRLAECEVLFGLCHGSKMQLVP